MATAPLLPEYLSQIYHHFETPVLSPHLESLLLPDPSVNRRLPALQKELQAYPNPAALDGLINTHNNRHESHPLNNLVAALLRYIRDVSPASKLASVDLIVEYYQALCTAFNNPQLAPKLTASVVAITKFTLVLAKQCDRATRGGENGFPRLTFLKSTLTNMFTRVVMEMKQEFASNPNYVIDPAQNPHDRKGIIVFLVNQLCRVYFTIGSPMSCANIFLNLDTIPVAWPSFSLALQIEHKYWLGRYYLLNQSLIKAYDSLKWAWDHCPAHPTPHHRRLLRYLLPCGLVLGKHLNGSCRWVDPLLVRLYQPLYHYASTGQIYSFNRYLWENEGIFVQHQVLTLLVSKCQVLLARNLFRKVYRLLGSSPKLHYAALLMGLQVAVEGPAGLPDMYLYFRPEGLNDLFLENVLVSLIDQGLLKAHVFSSLRLANTAKTDEKAWVKVLSAYRLRFV